MFDAHTINCGNLSHHEIHKIGRRQSHDEFVDDGAGALFENFDGSHVAAHRTNAARCPTGREPLVR